MRCTADPGSPVHAFRALRSMRIHRGWIGRAAAASAVAAALLAAPGAAPLQAQVDARMLRQPTVSDRHIAFVYAGDVWVVDKEGGTARRLSSPAGEESFPRFSPDGERIAFVGHYGGNADVYVLPTLGGDPVRVTHHPMSDRLLGWWPDGESLLFASSRESGRQRFNQFYRVRAEGGLPDKLAVPYGEFAAVSGDGRRMAYVHKSRAFRTWKRYRGGWAPDVWLFDLETLESRNLTDDPANDDQPMWHGETVYFLSDRGPEERYNLWAYDLARDELRQVTRFTDHDVHFPSIGPSEIVFEAAGRLHLLDLASEEARAVDVRVVTDRSTLRPRAEGVEGLIFNAAVSPSGKQALFEARGELFAVPAEHGPVVALARGSGSAERFPAWSPDGRQVAYWSDESGEYELWVRPADGTGAPRRVTELGPGFRYRPYWSPDSRKVAFIDQAMRIRIVEIESGRVTDVDRALWKFHGALNAFQPAWSPDSRWLAWARGLENRKEAIFLFDTRDGTRHQVTSGFYGDRAPAFDPEGRYLFYLSSRELDPEYSNLQNSWIYPNTTRLVAVPLRLDVPSPLAPRHDVEGEDEEEEEEEENGEENGERDARAGDGGGRSEQEPPPAVDIALADFERRAVVLPPEAGNYAAGHGGLAAAKGKVVYRRLPRTGAAEDADSPVLFWELEAREEKTVLSDADWHVLAAGGEHLLVRVNGKHHIVKLEPDQTAEKPLRTGEMEARVDPAAEWRQLFADAWRFQRDYFYDPNLHGLDWAAMRERYGRLLEDAVTRWDVNFVLGELIGELDASHTYRGGGDLESPPARGAGLLGADWELADGAYRIARILQGAPWDDAEVRSPLRAPGVGVREGDWVLAVNGVPLDPARDPWAAFDGLAGRTVQLTVNGRPTTEGARQVLVETLDADEETRLRHLAWVDANRRRVEEASGGRIGYVYVPDTGQGGQTELVRQFTAQFERDGLIVDERWNSGGQIPDRFVELLDRPPLAWWAVRDGRDWQWPPVAHFGPQAMLINGWSGSGGDAFPDYYRKREVGPLIGTRTWGGLIGITGAPPLVDGGGVTVPTFRMYDPDGEWFAEGHGVEPDIEVPEDPTALARGEDPQLERAIEWVMGQLEAPPFTPPERPEYEDRAPPRP